ncbi:MAG: MFS transporter [Myxococcales bacterium]|nr:MFS transporter [Myxococcales bacterium]
MPSARSRVTLILFVTLIGLLYADQNLLAPNLSAIGAEFGFSRAEIDQRLGADVNLMFWMLGGVVTLLVGYLTDRADLSQKLPRKHLLFAVAFMGQAACLASGLVKTYEQLYWARALTGLGIGGSFPLMYSLIGDYYPKEQRASANAVLGLASGLGIAVGQLLAGMLGPSMGWRVPFLCIAIPGMLANLLFLAVAREPARGATEEALRAHIEAGFVYEERIRLSDLPQLLRVRTNLLILLQALPGTVPWGVFFVYLNDYYAHDKGFSVPDATLLVMTIGAAALLGGFLGGLVGQKLHNRSSKLMPLLCAITTVAATIPMAVLINYPVRPGTPLFGPLAVGSCMGLLAAMTGPNVYTMLINVNPPERRGAAFSLLNLFNDLGRGLGAWVVGGMAATLGRVPAFHIANLMWLLCGAALVALIFILPREERALQARLAKLADGPR